MSESDNMHSELKEFEALTISQSVIVETSQYCDPMLYILHLTKSHGTDKLFRATMEKHLADWLDKHP